MRVTWTVLSPNWKLLSPSCPDRQKAEAEGRRRNAEPEQPLSDNSHTWRARFLCSPSPFSGDTPWDCPGGQLGAIITSTYPIRGLPTAESGDVPQASLRQGAVEAQRRDS